VTTALEISTREILYAAIAAETGLIVRITPHGEALRAKAALYRYRRELGDHALLSLSVHLSPDDPQSELWILRRDNV